MKKKPQKANFSSHFFIFPVLDAMQKNVLPHNNGGIAVIGGEISRSKVVPRLFN